MAEEREAKVRLDVEKTGDVGAFDDVKQDIIELDSAAEASQVDDLGESIGGLGDAASEAAPDVGELVDSVSAGKDVLDQATPSVAGYGDAWAGAAAKINTSLAIAQGALAATEMITEGLNKLMAALGGTGEEFKRIGPAIVPVKSFEELATAITDVNLYLDEHTGKIEEDIAAHEAAREKYLATRESLNQVATALQATGAEHEKNAAAAERSAERQAAAAAKAAADAQKHLDELRADSARRTEEELARIAQQEEEAAATAAANEQKAADLLAGAYEAAAARIAAAQQQIHDALGTSPDTSSLDTIISKTGEVEASAGRAATALANVINGGAQGPLSDKPTYEPPGGFLTDNPLGPRRVPA